ncbi:RNA polymerase subunit sigma [Sphingobium yanoikuyae]|jgi:DNA-directed RNA polymerase specialized sigma24 family protein|uniref:RNA polymerase subunit sigma n=1 Tax=Sphingobium yanoikuyae TaxID=13690 RepID=A0A177JPU2_SPHYA|nr:sigma-70 region 4 domain-containing protein [Sphingobium yanoikuyae]OAH43193.1 RNA polymerase subunit sigma [Sphingobium yanoikuyae]RSU71462.1 RNA polymerase subunit sigma [Sphingomonas sp. S-NIH.Pt3_0716]
MTEARAREALRRTLAKASERDMHVDVDPAILDRLEDAIRRLSRLQREIMLAVRLDDMDYAQIAERTGLSQRQVEAMMVRALINFQRNLADPDRHA